MDGAVTLLSLHDVVSDILASPVVPRAQKRAAILRAAAAYRHSRSTDERTKTWHR
jgi:hypothetical protein